MPKVNEKRMHGSESVIHMHNAYTMINMPRPTWMASACTATLQKDNAILWQSAFKYLSNKHDAHGHGSVYNHVNWNQFECGCHLTSYRWFVNGNGCRCDENAK